MKFRPALISAAEARLGRAAAATLSGSMLVFGLFLFLAFSSISNMWLPALFAALGFAAYVAQVHFLTTIGRHHALRRLRTWQLSLLAHVALFVASYLAFRDPIVFLFLIPEALSALIHLAGIRCASIAQSGA